MLVGEGPGVTIWDGVIVGGLCVGDGKSDLREKVTEDVCVAVHGVTVSVRLCDCVQAVQPRISKPRIKEIFLGVVGWRFRLTCNPSFFLDYSIIGKE